MASAEDGGDGRRADPLGTPLADPVTGRAVEELGPELGELYEEALLLVSRLPPDLATPLVDAVRLDSPLAAKLRQQGTGVVPRPSSHC